MHFNQTLLSCRYDRSFCALHTNWTSNALGLRRLLWNKILKEIVFVSIKIQLIQRTNETKKKRSINEPEIPYDTFASYCEVKKKKEEEGKKKSDLRRVQFI